MSDEVAIKTEPADLIALAIQKGAGIDEITKLVELAERMEDRQSERAFYTSLAQFQKNCPEIKRDKKADFGTTNNNKTGAKYNYAPLDSIVAQVKEPLAEAGLSYRFEDAEPKENMIGLKCVVSHIDGHSISVVMYAPGDSSGGKNSIQQIGSTMTYLRRYTMTGALGITTGDEDNDAHTPVVKGLPSDVAAKIAAFTDSDELLAWSVEQTQHHNNDVFRTTVQGKNATLKNV